jgi:hypothetical protein
MNEIYGSCFTNLDTGRTKEWPSIFVAVPQKGDYVESTDGHLQLKVVAVTFTQKRGDVPRIRVELNK